MTYSKKIRRSFQTGHRTTNRLGRIIVFLIILSTSLSYVAALPSGSKSPWNDPSALGDVNDFNGNLNMGIPLLTVGGRGETEIPLVLRVGHLKWRKFVYTYLQPQVPAPYSFHSMFCGVLQTIYGAGYPINCDMTNWTNPQPVKRLTILNLDKDLDTGYGPGLVMGESQVAQSAMCISATDAGNNIIMSASQPTVTRFTINVVTPDGGTHELIDKASLGKFREDTRINFNCNSPSTDPNVTFTRGTEFVSNDGSALTFISDTAFNYPDPVFGNGGLGYYPTTVSVAGYLHSADGSVSRIQNSLIMWIRDRNGNLTTFSYYNNINDLATYKKLQTVTDPLGRTVNINYDVNDTAISPNGTAYGLSDQIIYKGLGGAERVLRITKSDLGNVLRAGLSLKTPSQMWPSVDCDEGICGGNNSLFNPKVVSALWLPNGRSYKFQYNSFAEVARVENPTGAAVEYDHDYGVNYPGYQQQTPLARQVKEVRVYPDGSSGTFEFKKTYNRTITGNETHITIDGTDGSGNFLSRKKSYFYGKAFFMPQFPTAPLYGMQETSWKHGREYKTEHLAINGSVLTRTENTFQNKEIPWLNLSQQEIAPPYDVRLTEVRNTLIDTNQVTKKTFTYDQYNNQTDVYEYDFGSGTAGPLLRRTHTDYANATNLINGLDYSASNIHLRRLPTSLWISSDASGVNKKALTTYEYDNYGQVTPDNFHAPLTARPNIYGLDAAFSATYYKRGNRTRTTRNLLDANGNVIGSSNSHTQYDVAGNAVKTLDPRSTSTNIIASVVEFTDRFGSPDTESQGHTPPANLGTSMTYAFPTKVTNALNQITYTQYDYHLGLPVNVEDANGIVSSTEYGNNGLDLLDRPSRSVLAVNTGSKAQTTTLYDDAARMITMTSDHNNFNDNFLKIESIYDGSGRLIEERKYEGGGNYIATRIQYDGMDRAFKTSKSFRPWQSETPVWTTHGFDVLGRVVSVTTPDNAVVGTSYSGNTVTVTDQAGKQRKSVTDAVGRLVQVYEAPNDANHNYLTSYSYDPLDNLITVTQGTQTRTFVYDSLKRLTSSTYPESGPISYQYDANDNVLVRTDPRTDPVDSTRKVNVHFEYDALNRIKRRWYNGSSSVSATTHNNTALPSTVGATDEVKFYYDAQSLPGGAPSYTRGSATGRLVAQTSGTGSNGDYLAYDVRGRVTLKIQQTGTVNYQVGAAYNLAGSPTTLTYPSGRTVSHTYDQAGRLSALSGNLGDGATRTYATGILYSPMGGLVKEQFGTTTPVYNKLFYNVRSQLAEIRASTSYTGPNDFTWDRGAIVNSFSNQCTGLCSGSNMTDNNGNLLKQQIYIPGHTMRWQQYDYDPLNRLNSAREVLDGGAEQWKQQFTYDRWGNRTINTGATYGTGINNKAFTVNTVNNNNRLEVPTGQPGVMTYDAAGNLTNDTYTGAGIRTYDAENKITSAQGGNGQAQLYGYDAAGKRIKRTVNGVQTWQVYGIGSELVAEYAASGAATSPQKEYGYRNGQLLVTTNGNTGALTNFALNKTATQSSTHSSGAAASRAVDGNTDGVFANGSVTHTNNDANAWWHVDLGQVQSINTIKVWNRVESPERLTNFYVFVSDVPFTSTNLATTLSQSGVSSYQTTGQCGFPTDVAINRTGRYIRVQLAGTNYLHMAEVQVLGVTGPSNVALNKTATQSSTHSSGAAASRAVDGNTDGVFANGSVTHTNSDANAWWHVDLAQVQTIGTIKIWNRVESPERLTNFYVFVSDVPFTSNNLATTLSQSGVSSYQTTGQCGFPTELAINRTGRYVRVQLAGTNYLSIAEVQVWTGSSGPAIQWLITDQLGTPRMVLDQSGSLANIKRHDYLPFGEELFAPTGGRTAAMGYAGGDNVRQQFTAYERDLETNLDYAINRYYGSVQGRFTSVDPLSASAKTTDPQTWNRYAYTGNNPLVRIDPNGLDWWFNSLDKNPAPRWFNKDPGGAWRRWTGTYSLVYYDRRSRQWVALDPHGNRAFIHRDEERVRRVFQHFSGPSSESGLTNAERDFLAGVATGTHPFGFLTFSFLEENGIDTTSREFAWGSGLVLFAGGVTLVGSKLVSGSGLVRVGRWMSYDEYNNMVSTGLVQESNLVGVTSVTVPPNPNAYLNAAPKSVFVEFDIPQNVLHTTGTGWGKIYGPSSIFAPKYNITQMPPATGIVPTVSKVKN